jgi:hypothetical protein
VIGPVADTVQTNVRDGRGRGGVAAERMNQRSTCRDSQHVMSATPRELFGRESAIGPNGVYGLLARYDRV